MGLPMAALLHRSRAPLHPILELMKTLKWLLAGIIVGVIVVAFRDLERGTWLTPAIPRGTVDTDDAEPVLGYDGMDQETLLDWLPAAALDAESIDRIIRYESSNQNREPVLTVLEELRG
jgi:hypothetical protein